jgi:hypothetical protein
LFTNAQGFKPATRYGITLIGTEAKIYEGGLSGTLVRTTTFTRGTAREPTAPTLIGCRGNGVGAFTGFFNGLQYDIKINGTLWEMGDRNQLIQLPSPSGLGSELITPAVYETPFSKPAKWVKVGDSWTIDNPSVQTADALVFLPSAEMPSTGFIEFEIEAITGSLSCTNNIATGSVFNTPGKKRFFYSDYAQIGSVAWRFRVPTAGAFSCIIKNISFKPLGSSNPMTLVNTTSDRWQAVPCRVYADPLTPFFTQQPSSQSVAVGATPTFTADALVDQGTVTYQWQLNTGGGFADIIGATLKTLTLLPVVIGQNGNQFRVVVTANARPIFSAAATLTVTL